MSLVIKKSVAEALNLLIERFNSFAHWAQQRFFMMNEAFTIDIQEHNKRLKALEDLAGIKYVAPTDEEVNKMIQDKLRELAQIPAETKELPAPEASVSDKVDNVADKVDNESVVESKVKFHKEY